MIYTISYKSPVGELLLAEQDGSLIGLWNKGQKYYLGSVKETFEEKDTPMLQKTKAWLDRYFAGEKPEITELALNPAGTDFQQQVWQILRDIPYGTTVTYGDIAKQMANRLGRQTMSSQAVGGAVGHNPISIIVPCHRVVGKSGSLTGYAGGMAAKISLLTHEGVNMAGFKVPGRGTAL